MDSNPICHPSSAKKIKCFFLDNVQLLMIGRAGRWTQTPSATPLQPKNKMLLFGYVQLMMISWAGRWTQTPSATLCSQKIKWLFLDYVQLLMISRAVDGLKPCLPPVSSQKNKMFSFGLHSTYDDQLGWLMNSNPICHPSPAKKLKCSVLDYVQLLMIGWAGRWTQSPSTTPLQPKKMKCLFLDYVQLLMIGRVIQAMNGD